MTLTYRGQKYMRIQGADASKKAGLTYRGVSYAQGFTASKTETPRVIGAFFFKPNDASSKRRGRPARMEESANLAGIWV